MEQLLILVSVTFLCMVSPGPDMIVVMRNTFHGGHAAGLMTSLGVLSGNLVHISYCVLGIGWLISQSIMAFNVLKYLGAAYLVYLGLKSLLSGSPSLPDEESQPRIKNQSHYLQGFINNILNPKGTLFYLGVFTIVITPETPVIFALFLIVVMMSVSGVFWLVFVHTLDRPLIRNLFDRGWRTINRAFGVLLISVGLKVAVSES